MGWREMTNWDQVNSKPNLNNENFKDKFDFDVIERPTKKSIKFDITQNYSQDSLQKRKNNIRDFFKFFSEELDRQQQGQLIDKYWSISGSSYDYKAAHNFISSLTCSNHFLELGVYFDGNLAQKNLTGCKNCFFYKDHEEPLTDQKKPFKFGINKALQKNIYQCNLEITQFFHKHKNMAWRNEYDDYLNSENWRNKRAIVLKRDKYLCQGCFVNKATQVHHLSYKNVGDELLFQLISICDVCHEKCHEKE